MSVPPKSTPETTIAGADDTDHEVPSWMIGICGVAAVASALFSILMFLNR